MMSDFDLVTGGAGFIGSHLVDQLIAQGGRVRVLDNFVSGGPRNLKHLAGNPQLDLMQGDIRIAEEVSEAMRGVGRVFHLAALADIVPSIQRPDEYFTTNVDGTFTMLQAARAQGVRRFVYAASSSCYGIPDRYPTAETAELRPQYPYAMTKQLGEQLTLHWGQVY